MRLRENGNERSKEAKHNDEKNTIATAVWVDHGTLKAL
jgi:hypothetical protein